MIDSKKNTIFQATKEENIDADKKFMGYLKQIKLSLEESSRENDTILLLVDQRITNNKVLSSYFSSSKSSPRLEKRNLSVYLFSIFFLFN